MDIRFRPHNSHWEGLEEFNNRDPHLKELVEQVYVYRYPLLEHLPVGKPGIYSITGGRQIGKTTILKLWMRDLLVMGVPPKQIVYFTGELIDDHHVLVRLVTEQLAEVDEDSVMYFLLDEVTYIREWDRGVKFLADAGILDRVVLVLTGSDTVIIREARMRFPGRRGKAPVVDFHLFPLTFYESVQLKSDLNSIELERVRSDNCFSYRGVTRRLFEAFEKYLLHGGYLTAINDLALHGEVMPSTYATYCDWIRGDVLKRGKVEKYLREIFDSIIKRYGSQITWNGLAKDLSIDHPATIADYIELLSRMDAVFVQPALREDKLTAAPKKARKVMLTDPFIFHAVRSWLDPVGNPFHMQAAPLLNSPGWAGRLAEACATTHYRRFYPTYYIKGEGEVDIAYVKRRRFWPIEIKWTGNLRPKDLKQVKKYPNSRICHRSSELCEIHSIPAEPLPYNLLRLGPSPFTME